MAFWDSWLGRNEVIVDRGDEIEFKAYGKTPRWGKETTAEITEKLDGSNMAVIVTARGYVGAQSRNRLITPEQDHAGFAKWVDQNADDLADVLGEGHHYGEWYGHGVQKRTYGLVNGEKRFALFNPYVYGETVRASGIRGLEVVPHLYSGPLEADTVDRVMQDLKATGSKAGVAADNPWGGSPYLGPEGIIIYRNDTRRVSKATFDSPEGKWRDG